MNPRKLAASARPGLVAVLLVCQMAACAAGESVFPGATWESRAPDQLGLSREKLDALAALVGGRGCVVRHGYMAFAWGEQSKSSDVASAFKPLLSTLLF